MERKHKKKSLASKVLTLILIISTVLCFIVSLKAAVSKEISVFGYRFFYITTGSMEPTIPIGAVVIVHETHETYETGDIITFVSKDRAIYGMKNTHRIVGIQNENGRILYTTRGDANSSPDVEPVAVEDVIGRVIWQTGAIPLLGRLIGFLGTRFGFVLLVLLPLLLITVGCIKDFTREYKKEIKRIADEMNQAECDEKVDKR